MTDEKQKQVFANNLLNYISESGLTQKDIADKINVSPQTFNTWCQAIALPRMGKIQLLADYFGIVKSDLLEEKKYDSRHEIKGVKIPVLGVVTAGIPIYAAENIIDYEEISETMANRGEYFGLRIKGDSMMPYIFDKDIVIILKQSSAESGDIVIALVNGFDACCKKIMKYPWGIQLLSYNPDYEPMVYSNEQIENEPVNILGKVVEIRRKTF